MIRPVALERPLHEGERSLLVPCPSDIGLEDFAFVIDRAPQVVGLAVDLHKHLIKVPSPMAHPTHAGDPLATDIPASVRRIHTGSSTSMPVGSTLLRRPPRRPRSTWIPSPRKWISTTAAPSRSSRPETASAPRWRVPPHSHSCADDVARPALRHARDGGAPAAHPRIRGRDRPLDHLGLQVSAVRVSDLHVRSTALHMISCSIISRSGVDSCRGLRPRPGRGRKQVIGELHDDRPERLQLDLRQVLPHVRQHPRDGALSAVVELALQSTRVPRHQSGEGIGCASRHLFDHPRRQQPAQVATVLHGGRRWDRTRQDLSS